MSDNQIYNDRDLRKYVNTLVLVYLEAVYSLYDKPDIYVEYSVNKGLYTKINGKGRIARHEVDEIKQAMNLLIESDIPITKSRHTKEEAIEIFKKQNMLDKVKLFSTVSLNIIDLYRIRNNYYNIFGEMFDSTGHTGNYDLKLADQGIVILFPRKEDNYELPVYIHQEKLFNVFMESENWAKLLKVDDVGDLNLKIRDGSIDDIIRVSEALHEKKVAKIADSICNSDARIILIAGPSSSGKTTFANRLGIQLMVNGKDYITISLDDYFVDRELTPRDESGSYDFDTIDALDIPLFNKDLSKLLKGDAVQIPTFDFMTGKRKYNKGLTKVRSDQYIVIEGIHGMNDRLTESILAKDKYKIYISALTQLNLDDHNRVSTTELRLIRRMIRDNQFRGHNAEKTLQLWENVVKGENRYIFPYQENADVMFNSSLIYELSVLKKYALPVLNEIKESSPFNVEKLRLLSFLKYFNEIEDETVIPNTSIIKEFIGGSCFH
ncbi:MAG: Uridine kinase [Clostridiales bacterium 38_11]|nr:MAG: Uridine kinase [Clostridiales bacterium 38_11]